AQVLGRAAHQGRAFVERRVAPIACGAIRLCERIFNLRGTEFRELRLDFFGCWIDRLDGHVRAPSSAASFSRPRPRTSIGRTEHIATSWEAGDNPGADE